MGTYPSAALDLYPKSVDLQFISWSSGSALVPFLGAQDSALTYGKLSPDLMEVEWWLAHVTWAALVAS